jgi:signal transduction histidine kinase
VSDVSHGPSPLNSPGRRLAGEGPEIAARQAAVLFLLAGVLAIAGTGTQPDKARELLIIAAADFASAALAWSLPWRRWRRYSPLLLCFPALATLAFSTWAFGGFATGTGPFFVLVFAWLGLHFPAWAIAVMLPPAAVAYVAPLVVTHQPPVVVSSAVILLPIVAGIAALIANQVAHLREAREHIHQIERWRAALTAMLAHDVRSPLTAVQLALGALRSDDDRLSPARKEAIITAALRQTARINRLAAGLLDLDRVDIRGALKLDRQQVQLRRAVDNAIGYLNAKDVVIKINPDLVVSADPERLEQMLVNLTTNALRHGRLPVIISGEWTGEIVRIHVRDHGEGVPESDVPSLFSRFSSARRGDSVGLGLWIVHELARAHGGDVSYEPAHPGARFTVTMPVAPRSTAT